MLTVSVVILTRDRLPKLRACLDALMPQLSSQDEVLVVDTGSKDGTLEFLASGLDPRIRTVAYIGAGSWAEARNAGVQHSKAESIAFLDDDCAPAKDWVERGRALLVEVEAAGGYVEPGGIEHWPDWWDARMGWLVGLSIPGHLGEYAGSYFYPYTSNLWTRAELARKEPFQQLGGEFGEDDGKRYLLGREDAEWWRRIRVKGHFTKFDPALRVAHFIEPERLTMDYLTQRARRDGEAWARREGRTEDLDPIAYQIWRWQYFEQGNNPLDAEADSPPAYQSLMLERNRAALRALSEKIAAANPHGPGAMSLRQKALLRAARRYSLDRARSIGRRLALAFSPTPDWRPPTERPKRLTILAFGHVGDLVIFQSVLRGLLQQYRDLQVTVIGNYSAHVILGSAANEHGVDRCALVAPNTPFHVEMTEVRMKDYSSTESGTAYVVAPYLHAPGGPPFLQAFSRMRERAPAVISFDRDNGLERMLHKARIQKTIHKDLTIHETDNLRRLFGLGTDPPMFDPEPAPAELRPNDEAVEKVRKWRAALPESVRERPVLLLNPDAAYRQKEWPEESWIALIGSLIRSTECSFVLNLSRPAHPLARLLEEKFSGEPRIVPLLRWPLEDLIALMSISRAVVTVDSAPQHLAHALNIPSLTLYGPMDERRWADRWKRPIHRTIRGGMFDLTPEERRGLPENHLMTLIGADRVLAELVELIR